MNLSSVSITPTSYEVKVSDELFETVKNIDHKNQVIVVYNDCDYSYKSLINDFKKIDFTDLSKKLHISINHALEIDSLYATWTTQLINDKFHKIFTLKLVVIHELSRDQKIFTKILNYLKSTNVPFMIESIMNKSLYRHLMEDGFSPINQYSLLNLYYIPEGYYDNSMHQIDLTSSNII